MKIGIGITTFRRPEVLAITLAEWDKYIPECDNVFFVQQDTEPPRGIAAQKNICLRKLIELECDYIFLFDDDIYPKTKDWYQPFIESGINHMVFGFADGIAHEVGTINGIYPYYNTPKGCMLYFTRGCIESAGGFDEKFGLYGFEHIELSGRIHRMGLIPEPFISIPDIKSVFHAIDFEGGISSALSEQEKRANMDEKYLYSLQQSQSNQKIPL